MKITKKRDKLSIEILRVLSHRYIVNSNTNPNLLNFNLILDEEVIVFRLHFKPPSINIDI